MGKAKNKNKYGSPYGKGEVPKNGPRHGKSKDSDKVGEPLGLVAEQPDPSDSGDQAPFVDLLDNLDSNIGDTPLHMAAGRRFVEEVKALLAAGSDPNVRDKLGRTPLHSAFHRSSADIINAALAFTCGVAFGAASRYSAKVKVVQALLDAGANPSACDEFGNTPLCLAVNEDSVEIVKALLAAGAGPDPCDKYGWTPLHAAACYNKSNIVKALLEAGADLNRSNVDGDTPLHLAVKKGHVEIVKAALAAGANPNIRNKDDALPDSLNHWDGFGHEQIRELFAARRASLEEASLLDCLPPGKAASRSSAL